MSSFVPLLTFGLDCVRIRAINYAAGGGGLGSIGNTGSGCNGKQRGGMETEEKWWNIVHQQLQEPCFAMDAELLVVDLLYLRDLSA